MNDGKRSMFYIQVLLLGSPKAELEEVLVLVLKEREVFFEE